MPTEPSWLLILINLAAGFLLLAKGADWLVESSSQIARRFGISVLVVGLTVIAFGTSAPEIVVSGLAALEGKADISLGNVLGSNIANIGLVLGACAVVLPRVLESRLAHRELFWLFLSLGVTWWIIRDRAVVRMEGAFLLATFVVYNVHVLMTARETSPPKQTMVEQRRPGLWVALGIAAIALGAKLVVMGAEDGALALGIPASVVGLTVVSVGTSLPELAAGLGGAFKGESDISLGNVVGSNVFNLLAVIGLVSVIQPLDPALFGAEAAAELDGAFSTALNEDVWVVLGFSLAAVFLPRIGGSSSGRAKGVVLLVGYVLYTAWLYSSR